MRYLDSWNAARVRNAEIYVRALEGTSVSAPVTMDYASHVFHVFAVRSTDRDSLQKHLTVRQIQTNIHYPFPVHCLDAYADLGYAQNSFPRAEHAAREVLSLPMFPELTEAQILAVAEAIREFKSESLAAGSTR
jgi:dTDP-4-amino-4,6-dideoxygalactose transaminase